MRRVSSSWTRPFFKIQVGFLTICVDQACAGDNERSEHRACWMSGHSIVKPPIEDVILPDVAPMSCTRKVFTVDMHHQHVGSLRRGFFHSRQHTFFSVSVSDDFSAKCMSHGYVLQLADLKNAFCQSHSLNRPHFGSRHRTSIEARRTHPASQRCLWHG